MSRDNRDPQEIGIALETQREYSPTIAITTLADEVLSQQTIRDYEESNEHFHRRLIDQGRNGHQLEMFSDAA
jgi:DNA-binding GntR family transcriptional regulator